MSTRIRKLRIITKNGRIILEEEITPKSVTTKDLDSAITLFRLISNESRYKIIRLISEKNPISFTKLHELSGYSQKTIAQGLDDLLRIRAISKESNGYMLSVIGKLLLRELKEIASIIKKIRDLQDLEIDFEF
ncbi:MAG: hypothetical protein ACUVXA_10575 [Candidatus Jordarchaeum sp.]|uniref:hypothetical protein n=1 Tax=Candidatus Jordarchaeum sp. TaxID=2823881 RepID=UPI0040495B9A